MILIIITLISLLMFILLFSKRKRFFEDRNFKNCMNDDIPRLIWFILFILTLIPIFNITIYILIYFTIVKELVKEDIYYKLGKLSSKLMKPL
jgi:hypothetical protein